MFDILDKLRQTPRLRYRQIWIDELLRQRIEMGAHQTTWSSTFSRPVSFWASSGKASFNFLTGTYSFGRKPGPDFVPAESNPSKVPEIEPRSNYHFLCLKEHDFFCFVRTCLEVVSPLWSISCLVRYETVLLELLQCHNAALLLC